jgi:hypothetical protein
MSAQTKLCIDRWYALQGPRGNALAGKQIGIVLTWRTLTLNHLLAHYPVAFKLERLDETR